MGPGARPQQADVGTPGLVTRADEGGLGEGMHQLERGHVPVRPQPHGGGLVVRGIWPIIIKNTRVGVGGLEFSDPEMVSQAKDEKAVRGQRGRH